MVVTRGNQRAYVIHTLRAVKPGTRVRIGGIKWGTPTSGIKWAAPRPGIKWGIKWARNGTFQSRLTVLPGRLASATLRGGRVIRRYGQSAVAVSFPGGTYVVKVSRRAVWLPGGKITSSAGSIADIGSTVDLRVSIGRKGGIVATQVLQQKQPLAGDKLPLAGRIAATDLANRTLTISSSSDPIFPLDTVVTVPVGVDLATYSVGTQLASTVVIGENGDTTTYAATLSKNGSFAEADAAETTVSLLLPNPVHVATIEDMLSKWEAGNAAGLIPRNGLYQSEQNRLERVKRLIITNDKPAAVAELTKFEAMIDCPPGPPGEDPIDKAFATEMTALSVALRAALAA
jgi:hypothetical protein